MIFSEYAPTLYNNGFSVLWAEGKRITFKGWDEFKFRRANASEFETWEKDHADANIGLPMGPYNNFAALDIDFGELFEHVENRPLIYEWSNRIAKLVPATPFIRTGMKPWAALYKFSEQTGGPFTVNGIKVGELITRGQVIIPPSIHPDTGEEYKWVGGFDLSDFDLTEAQSMVPDFTDVDFAKLKAELETFILPEAVPVMPKRKNDKTRTASDVVASGIGGRNDMLKNMAMRIFEKGKSVEACAAELMSEDIRLHDVPLFSDPLDDFAGLGAEAASLKFASNIHKTFVRAKVSQGAALPDVEAQAAREAMLTEAIQGIVEYPSRGNGFFHLVPRINSNGKSVMREEPDLDGLARFLGVEDKFLANDAFIYKYDVNHYRFASELEIKHRIDALTLNHASPREVKDFLQAACYKNFRPTSFFQNPNGLLNLANGYLDIKTGTLMPHDPAVFFKYALPQNFDANAQCPEWLKFLDFVFEGNQSLADLSGEIFGYILQGGTPWLHKAFFLDGSGRNGKSTWLDVLKAMIGDDNYSSIPMRNLEKPFSVVMADGKLANIVGELEGKDLNSEVFKIAVGGEELIAARKGRDEYKLKFQARLVFATNNPPNFKDASAGYYERLCVLPFKRFIKAEERDSEVGKRLLGELPGILNWALEGLNRLMTRGRLPDVDVVQDQIAAYREANDSVYRFLNEAVIPDELRQSTLIVGSMYEGYAAWCRAEGCFALQKNIFSRNALRDLKARYPNMLTDYPHNKAQVRGYFTIRTYRSVDGWLTQRPM